jgi:ABC-type branched-subunit amino acid transport system substrate-binding protein
MIRRHFLLLAAVVLGLSGCPESKKGDPAGGGDTGGGDDYAVFVGGDGVFSPDFVRLAEGAAEGSYIVTPYVNDTSVPAIAAFSKAFNERFKQEPDAWAALTYDAVGTMCKAIEVSIEKAGKPDRTAVKDALTAMNASDNGDSGVTGVTFFDENGDCKKPALISIVEGGKLVKAKLQLSEASPPAEGGDATAAKKAEGDPILIGVAGPFTGVAQKYGEMIKAGAQLKMDEINAAGGVGGRPLTIKWGDDEGNNSKAANVANDFIADPDLVAVVGHFNSTCSLAAKPVYKNAGIPALSPGSTNVDVCQGSEWYFRNLYRDDFQGFTVADFIKTKLKKTKVVVFYDNDDYGTGLKTFFAQKAKELGLEIKKEIPYNRESTTDFTPLVTNAKYEAPEVIFVAGLYNEASLIVKACKKAGITK